MGPSGSGKSTLLNLIAGLDRPSRARSPWPGGGSTPWARAALARFRARHVGIIFQFFNLLDDLTVEDNVLLPAQLAGASRRTGPRAGGGTAGPAGPRAATATTTRPGCPAASGSGWRSPGPWSTRPSCCWPTSRPARSTPPPGRRSGGCCRSSTRPGRPWSWSPTTRRWPERYAARTVQHRGRAAGRTPACGRAGVSRLAGWLRSGPPPAACGGTSAGRGDRAGGADRPPPRPRSGWRCWRRATPRSSTRSAPSAARTWPSR